jgi:hypothetical protein
VEPFELWRHGAPRGYGVAEPQGCLWNLFKTYVNCEPWQTSVQPQQGNSLVTVFCDGLGKVDLMQYAFQISFRLPAAQAKRSSKNAEGFTCEAPCGAASLRKVCRLFCEDSQNKLFLLPRWPQQCPLL